MGVFAVFFYYCFVYDYWFDWTHQEWEGGCEAFAPRGRGELHCVQMSMPWSGASPQIDRPILVMPCSKGLMFMEDFCPFEVGEVIVLISALREAQVVLTAWEGGAKGGVAESGMPIPQTRDSLLLDRPTHIMPSSKGLVFLSDLGVVWIGLMFICIF